MKSAQNVKLHNDNLKCKTSNFLYIFVRQIEEKLPLILANH